MELSQPPAPSPESVLAIFLRSLLADGRVVLTPKPLSESSEGAPAILEQLDAHSRAEIGLECPEYDPAMALWAARLFYQLCQFSVCRDIGEDQIVKACRQPGPAGGGPERDWSGDLVLRHLPTLARYVSRVSETDPLGRELKNLAAAWPLSSVGMEGLSGLSVDSFIGHPALRRLYADRIVAANDVSRLGDPRIDDLIRADLGLHRELAPKLADRLAAAKNPGPDEPSGPSG